MGRAERLALRCGRQRIAAALVAAVAFPIAVAGLAVISTVVQSGRYLYYPPRWEATRHLVAAPASQHPGGGVDRAGMGGVSDPALPLRIMVYSAKPGDTLSGIASAFGLELDTVSSLNRDWGNGVHSVAIGEKVRIPNQNGIYLALRKSLEELCKDNGVLPETVLAANSLRASEVRSGSSLFFPGVQHRGVEKELVAGTAFLYPVMGWVSSGYGMRIDPFSPGVRRAHYGVDLVAPAGTPVRAASAGTVWLTAYDVVFGNQVLIGHQFGFSTFYAHLDRIVVRPGQQVTQETIIGYVGATGRATGPHLHFEIRSGGAPIYPLTRMAPRW